MERKLYNWLVDMCEEQGLDVRGDEKKECEYLLKATRDALQAIDGREGSFQYSLVPEAFKTYKVGAHPVKRSKAPSKLRLESGEIQRKADKLRGAIDRHAFTRSPLWASFVGDCNELYNVLTSKFDKMRGAARDEAERNAVPTVQMATISAEIIEPCEAGTIERYASLERKLLAMQNYDILELTEEMIASFHPPSEEARTESALRKHYSRYRDNLLFHSVAVKKVATTFGSARKLMLFIWKVPTAREERTESDNDRTLLLVKKRIPDIHSREVKREFKERYSHAVVTPGVLRSMYALLTSDGSAPKSSLEKAVDEAVFKFLAAGGDVELFPDLRALNSGERDKYNLFWAAGDRVLASLEACAADDRHGENRTLLQPLSVPDLRRRIVEQLVSEGHPEPTAPCDEWISFQFAPRCPSRTIATRHTGRWDITLKVRVTHLLTLMISDDSE